MNNKTDPVHIAYFSDVLCVWAYTAQIRLDELKREFGPKIELTYHFIPIFGCTDNRIGEGWKARGDYQGFGQHVLEVCKSFPHVQAHPQIWTRNIPKTSASGHLFLKAVQLLEQTEEISPNPVTDFNGRSLFEEAVWRLRQIFFRDARNVATEACQLELAEDLKLPIHSIQEKLRNGEAIAAMCRDLELRDEFKVEGSPTYILNEGRQKLYGNLGYKILEANIREILDRPEGLASWC